MNLTYLIVGAGATGGCIGGYLASSGKDVTLIARGAHLETLQTKGLIIEKADGTQLVIPHIKALSQEEYHGMADVIFICVKGYSLQQMIPFILDCCHENTVVIPILNVYGTGEKLSEQLPGIQVLDGCMYIASEIIRPGTIKQKGHIFRVVFGPRDGATELPLLRQIEADLSQSGITPMLSSDVKVDTYRKFSYVSAQNAVGLYYDANAGMIKNDPSIRETFMSCVDEIRRLGLAMGVTLEPDIAQINYDILAALAADMTTSMQKDIRAGKASEIDGLIFEVVRLGQQYNVALPTYEKIAKRLQSHRQK